MRKLLSILLTLCLVLSMVPSISASDKSDPIVITPFWAAINSIFSNLSLSNSSTGNALITISVTASGSNTVKASYFIYNESGSILGRWESNKSSSIFISQYFDLSPYGRGKYYLETTVYGYNAQGVVVDAIGAPTSIITW